MMRLADLDPQLLRYERRADGEFYVPVAALAEAQGVRFLCPKCFKANGGRIGTHGIICWSRSRGVPDDVHPTPGRWALDGSSLADLTINADPPSTARSIQLHDGCAWHGQVTNGEVLDV